MSGGVIKKKRGVCVDGKSKEHGFDRRLRATASSWLASNFSRGSGTDGTRLASNCVAFRVSLVSKNSGRQGGAGRRLGPAAAQKEGSESQKNT